MKYYHIHVDDKPGFSVWIKSEKTLSHDEIIQETLNQNKIDAEDAKHVDAAEETTHEDYVDATQEERT